RIVEATDESGNMVFTSNGSAPASSSDADVMLAVSATGRVPARIYAAQMCRAPREGRFHLVGNAFDEDGQPLQDAQIQLRSPFVGGEFVESATSDAAGLFHFCNVPVFGDLEITANYLGLSARIERDPPVAR